MNFLAASFILMVAIVLGFFVLQAVNLWRSRSRAVANPQKSEGKSVRESRR